MDPWIYTGSVTSYPYKFYKSDDTCLINHDSQCKTLSFRSVLETERITVFYDSVFMSCGMTHVQSS